MDESHARMTWWGEMTERFASTPFRTFALYPIIILIYEIASDPASFSILPLGIVFLIWGYGQYRLVGNYRMKIAGGGPGLGGAPPERLVTSGPYSITRNLMYLGHLIFMYGLILTFKSWLAAVIFIFHLVWFHRRVLRDEDNMLERFGGAYEAYASQVKRWIPGMF